MMNFNLIEFSVKNKLIVILFTLTIVAFGIFSLTQIPLGTVPDVTNNQVQVITTSRNLSTQDVEQFITYPVELEMANLPGVKEIRSISKFGLSVVTVVFEDHMGPYLPRQLISEKLAGAAEVIPEGFGAPEMGPITTGLGEIYQYVLDTRPGFETKYSTMDLRTIQDWIVKRQLSGIPGVVEINTWGGYLKQYEVAVDPAKLRSLNLSVVDVYDAMVTNNENTGAAYIEKGSQTYFIRSSGMAESMEDILNIVVKNIGGNPVLIRDIGEVRYGYANRFGAITANGQGEKVMGQIMMLKDANQNKVISDIKARVEEIQKTLPEGIYINPFLERSELIGKTTFTVIENLTLGALIVIFVVVLLLGNIRSGLIVASVIPVSLLFGISLMYISGLSANLMSLGAIDFGIIIDGAVIIVEFTVHQFALQSGRLAGLTGSALRRERDAIAISSSDTMMRSAVFGQVIILIVFIPILSLSGVEGKMFQPMAWSFSFALIGAMILCFTYVPVMAALFMNPKAEKSMGISDSLLNWIYKLYDPTITWALNHQKTVLTLTLAVFLSAMLLFTRIGGEFIPTLDEGDLVIQPVLKPGMSLSENINFCTDVEKILIKEFPEVTQVVSRIGAAEVPTDPMSMEMSDIIVRLKPKRDWVSAQTKEELTSLMKEKIAVFPGVEFEFTQPIEMRLNELITGVRADLAIKIFGDDLNILYNEAMKIRNLIKDTRGIGDMSVEQVEGLPQMTVKYNRSAIAKYGLNISGMNRIIRAGFAGETAGSVFEGEKRFDLVIRFKSSFRSGINDLRNIMIPVAAGNQVALSELAAIDYTFGPAQISRDATKRRIVIGINVRDRDVQSLVSEISVKIESKVRFPEGYYIQYGGQFENLQNAKRRLAIAVPVALALILIMLHFTFGSIKQALLVYSSIPLAAIGGVILLWLRGLSFSISAGVGFIALFGIATLNGIVLISFFNELKQKGITDMRERILTGARQRLRPVILTAAAAALGFLPMAFSASAGAEVQRPLATVVIGGLVSATFLTLVILPVLYCRFSKEKQPS
jgi:cobalt-zinc-cadmium resistance protein CzcA